MTLEGLTETAEKVGEGIQNLYHQFGEYALSEIGEGINNVSTIPEAQLGMASFAGALTLKGLSMGYELARHGGYDPENHTKLYRGIFHPYVSLKNTFRRAKESYRSAGEGERSTEEREIATETA